MAEAAMATSRAPPHTHIYTYVCISMHLPWLHLLYIAVLTLAVLTLAGPHCSSISDALDDNRALTDLNLSATAVGSFKDIPHLARLRHLRTLAFSDLHYGESPV